MRNLSTIANVVTHSFYFLGDVNLINAKERHHLVNDINSVELLDPAQNISELIEAQPDTGEDCCRCYVDISID